MTQIPPSEPNAQQDDILARPRTIMPPSPEAPDPDARTHRVGLSVLALIGLLGTLYVAHPVWMGIVVGTAMGFTSEPLYRRLVDKARMGRPLAALLTTITGGIAIVTVITLVTWIAITEIAEMISEMRVPSAPEVLGSRGMAWIARLKVSPDEVVKRANDALVKLSEKLAGGIGEALSATTAVMLTSVIAFFTMYYVLLEWSSVARRLERLLPLHPLHTRALVSEFRTVGRSALVGTMGTALVQGFFGGVGYTIAGVSQPMLWGTITMLASFLPVVGTAAVWLPIALSLGLSGRTGWGVFVAIWGFFVVMAVSDYVIRPKLVGSHGQVHPLPLLVSLLGGVEMFGLMGVVIGPILMSLCLSILQIYGAEIETSSRRAESPPGGDQG